MTKKILMDGVKHTFVPITVLSADLHNGYKRHDAHEILDQKMNNSVSDEITNWHADRNIRAETYVSVPKVASKSSVYRTWEVKGGYLFADPKLATLFKLTFGGAA